jgi:hypothetical protein
MRMRQRSLRNTGRRLSGLPGADVIARTEGNEIISSSACRLDDAIEGKLARIHGQEFSVDAAARGTTSFLQKPIHKYSWTRIEARASDGIGNGVPLP